MKERLSTDCLIMGFLMKGPSHGYDIWARFKEVFSGIWSSSPSQFYLLLSKMEKDGYLISQPGRSGNRPPKRVFQLTEKGRKRFLEWLLEPVESMRRFRVEALAKVYFIMDLFPEKLEEFLLKEMEICRGKLSEIKAKMDTEKEPFKKLVYLFKASHVETNIKWIEKVLSTCKTLSIE